MESLKREGVDTIFGLPGVQLDWAFDALYDGATRSSVVHTRHEQATAYMADGYARTTGKVGTCLVVPGPGRAERDGGALDGLRLQLAGPLHDRADPVRPDRRRARRAARDRRPARDAALRHQVGRRAR